jgi:hypothetical protein
MLTQVLILFLGSFLVIAGIIARSGCGQSPTTAVVFRCRRRRRMVRRWHVVSPVVIPMLVSGLMAVKTTQLQLCHLALPLDEIPTALIALILFWNWYTAALSYQLTGFMLKWVPQDAGMDIPAYQRRDILTALVLIDWSLGAFLGTTLAEVHHQLRPLWTI